MLEFSVSCRMLASAGKIYISGDVEIDAAGMVIRRAGEPRSLRPKSFQLLLYLIANRDRLVPKDELIERIWPDTAVTDGALAQCITDLRKALGEDSRDPRFIRTAAKLGYQFIGPVEVRDGRAPETKPQTLMQPEPPPPESPHWRRIALVAGLGLVVLIAGSLGSRTYWPGGLLPNTLEPGIRTAVFPFENRSGKPELDWMRIGLADMLMTSFSSSPRIAVISPTQLQRELRRGSNGGGDPVRREDAVKAGKSSGAKVVVLGAFASLGETIRLDTQIYEVETGRLIGGESLTAEDPGRLLAQLDGLSAKVAARLGAPLPAQTRLAEVVTNNLEAYRLYSLGLGLTRALRLPEAIELFQKAAALDPRFAMAHARIGYAYSVSWGQPAKGKPYLEQAYRELDRLTPRDRLFIRAWYGMACQDYASAERAYREILSEFPAEIEVYLSLSSLLKGDRRPSEALQILERGLTIEPEMPDLHNMLAGVYTDLGQSELAIESARRYVSLTNGEPNAFDSLGLVYHQTGHYQEARNAYLRAIQKKPDFEIAIIHLGNLYFQLGRYREAEGQFLEYIRHSASDAERARGHSSLAWMYWRKGDSARAQTQADQAARLSPQWAGESLLLAADRGTLKLTEDVRRQILAPEPYAGRGSRLNERRRLFLAGYIALRDHRTDEALAHFRAVLQDPPIFWHIDPLETCLADALLETGHPAEAAAEYRRILRANNNPLARYRLGFALDRMGSKQEAGKEFERFLEAWKDADADVPEAINARRALLAAGY